MKILNQHNYDWVPYPNAGDKDANIETSGCGIVSAAMILINILGVDISVSALAVYSIKNGCRASAGTDMKKLVKCLLRDYPELIYKPTNDEEVLKEHLAAGGMAIMNSDGNQGCKGIFAYGGHYLAILGLRNGKPLIADPAWTSSRYKTADRKKYVTDLGGGWVTCDWYVLDMDTKYRSPNYYLFGRKATIKKTEDEEMVYKDITKVPEWGKEAVQRRIDGGYTDGKNLTESMVRCWVVDDREDPIYWNLEDVPPYWLEEAKEMVAAGVIAGDGVHQVAKKKSVFEGAVIAWRIKKMA